MSESDGKAALAAFGVPVPRRIVVPARGAAHAAVEIGFPVVIKAAAAALEHKSEVGGVILNVRSTDEAEAAARRLAKLSDTLLVEQMITDGVAEILVGISVDAQFGQMLVLGAGGVLTELLRDSVSLLPPFTRGLRHPGPGPAARCHDCWQATAAARRGRAGAGGCDTRLHALR